MNPFVLFCIVSVITQSLCATSSLIDKYDLTRYPSRITLIPDELTSYGIKTDAGVVFETHLKIVYKDSQTAQLSKEIPLPSYSLNSKQIETIIQRAEALGEPLSTLARTLKPFPSYTQQQAHERSIRFYERVGWTVLAVASCMLSYKYGHDYGINHDTLPCWFCKNDQ
jgi:hypothetical protein